MARLNREICPLFRQAGCRNIVPPCGGAAGMEAACVQARCTDFPPARWRSVALTYASGGPTTFCRGASEGCTLWKVTPDRALLKIAAGRTTEPILSPEDFATIDTILRSLSFREDQRSDFSCGSAPSVQRLGLEVQRDQFTTGYDVSTCLTSTAANDPNRLLIVLSRY